MYIRAIIINGFHQGHVLDMEYHPTIKLPVPKRVIIDDCCDGSIRTESENIEEYQECFRSVDKKTILYSSRGKSYEIGDIFDGVAYHKPWKPTTILHYGIHGNFLKRED